MNTGDTYKRREVSPGLYQCGCKWTDDVLVQCPIHHQATVASVEAFERERAARHTTTTGGSNG